MVICVMPGYNPFALVVEVGNPPGGALRLPPFKVGAGSHWAERCFGSACGARRGAHPPGMRVYPGCCSISGMRDCTWIRDTPL